MDEIIFRGDSASDVITGSTRRDQFFVSGADSLYGGDNRDTFTWNGPGDLVANAHIDGGSGGSDFDVIRGYGVLDFATKATTFVEIEYVEPLAGATFIFSGEQIAGFSGVLDAGAASTETLIVRGSSVNLGTVTFFSWGTEDIISLVGTGGDDTLTGSNRADSLNGAGGTDTLSGGYGNDLFYGGAGNDTLNGGGNDDLLRGDAGADVIFGGDGFDTADYRYGRGANIDTTTGYVQDGEAFTDSVDQVEQFFGSLAYHDVFKGNALVNYFSGFGGNDYVIAADGAADVYNGGDGFDTISYYYARGAIVNLAAGTAVDGTTGFQAGSTDTVSGFEEVYGSGYYADTIIGDAGNNTFWGYGGNDALVGGRGLDTYNGGLGNDIFGFNASDLQAGVWDIIADFHEVAGTDRDALYFNGVAGSTLLVGEANGGVYVSTQALGGNGGVFIANFTAAQLADQLMFT